MPGKKTTTGTLPTSVVLEKDRFGGEDLGAVGTVTVDWGKERGTGWVGAGLSSPATVS